MRRAEFARLLGAPSGAAAPAVRGAVVIAEREPSRFQVAFAAAAASGANVFLADSAWGATQRAELDRILQHATQYPTPPAARPSAGFEPDECSDRCSDLASAGERGWLMIPSGGTGGRLKFARHDQATIAAAVRGFCAHFQIRRVNAVGVLPLHHVSGFMAWMRCVLTDGEYVAWDWKQLERGITPARFADGEGVISLVPTQLQRLLATPATVEWLRGFRAIFVGGGPAWSSLLDAAAAARLRIAPSYGMTETAAMVAALRPDEFLAGERSAGTALPHADLAITRDGIIRVGGESIFRGYFPDWCVARAFETEDLGTIDAAGHLTILGRRDAMIITGGKKVNAAEVEQALRASGEFADVAIIGIPDSEWGEIVVACYPASARSPNFTRAAAALAAHQRPKRFVAINDWPRNEQGKVNRAVLRNHCAAGHATSGVPKPIPPEPPHGAGGD